MVVSFISSVPIWAMLMAFAVAIVAAGVWVKDAWATRCGAVIFAAYAAMQIKKIIFSDNDLAFVASAAVWVIASGAIPHQAAISEHRGLSPSALVRASLVASGMCYLWARIVDAPREFGSPPYLTADLLLIAAMLIIGWQVRDDLLGRIRDMGSSLSHRNSGVRGLPLVSDPAQACKKSHGEVSPGKVRLHG